MSTETYERVTYYDGTPSAITYERGEQVTVHDPCGDLPGQIVGVSPSHLYIQGPPLGGGDSRSWHWTISYDKSAQYVSKTT